MSQELLYTCPLITDYTRAIGLDPNVLGKLYALRKWEIDPSPEPKNPVPFLRPSLLRDTIWDPHNNVDTGIRLRLRQYQIQMIHHLCRMPKFICGDAVGLGKTLDVIAATCWRKERNPDLKVIVVTTKSTTWQWHDEYIAFSTMRPYVMRDTYRGMSSSPARLAQMTSFLEGNKKDVMVVKYSSMIGARKRTEAKFDDNGKPIVGGFEELSDEIKNFSLLIKKHKKNVVLVFDECHKFKSAGSQTRNLAWNLSFCAHRVWALTATVIKNGLDEFYSVAAGIGIQPLGSLGDFREEYCVFRDQWNGRTSKPVLMGYKNVEAFKRALRPFFYGRSQLQVKEPMPKLSTIYHPIDLDAKQAKLLLEDIPNGTFRLPPTLIKVAGEIIERERDPNNEMTMLSVQQLVANHWALLDKLDEKTFYTKVLSPKEEALLDMLDGDFRGEKVIVYTKYRTWIDRLERITKNGHFTERKFLRITGAEDEKQRAANKRLFQDPNSGYDLIVINAAGTEGINLQQAAHMILLDMPWSWGDLIQLVGRMVRMASPHSACTLHILPAKGTIDEYAIETLKGKKGVFEKILGQSHSAGLLDSGDSLDLDSGMEQAGDEEQFRDMLRAHVKSVSMKTFLMGEQIVAAKDANYKMVFEKGRKHKAAKQVDYDGWGLD